MTWLVVKDMRLNKLNRFQPQGAGGFLSTSRPLGQLVTRSGRYVDSRIPLEGKLFWLSIEGCLLLENF